MAVHTVDWFAKTGPRGNIREAVGVFDSVDEMDQAVEEMEEAGIPEIAISRLAALDRVSKRIGGKKVAIPEMEDDPAIPRRAYVHSDGRAYGHALLVLVPTYFGAVAGATIAAAQGAGISAVIAVSMACGLVGAALGSYAFFWRRERERAMVERERGAGGLLLWVHTSDAAEERAVLEILNRHHARDVHMHGPAREAA